MSVHSHRQTPDARPGPAIGRPPYDATAPNAPKRTCSAMIRYYVDGVLRQRPCSAGAHWLLPEQNFCAHHIPSEFVPILTERARRWTEYAASVWLWVIEEVPL